MKVYLEDGGAPAPKKGKGSQPTTQHSSRSGGFKPTRPGRETYDSQGFGGAGRRRNMPADEQPEESVGRDVGVPEDEDFGPLAAQQESEGDEAEGMTEGAGDGEEDGFPEPEPESEPQPRGRKPSRRSMDSGDMTEAEFEAYMAQKNKKGGGLFGRSKQEKQPKATRGNKEKASPITLGKNARATGKKGAGAASAKGKGRPAPISVVPPKVSGKKSTKSAKVESPEDDFDEIFGGHDAPPQQGESIVSQIITIIEVVVGMSITFFGASQLGNILINNIMSGG